MSAAGAMGGGSRIPALVLGAGINGLGVARSLGAERVPVTLADTDASRPELRTRHAEALRVGALQGEVLIRELLQLAAGRFAGQRPVLVLTQEQTVRSVAAAQEELDPHYRFMLPDAALLDALMHKEGFDRLAQETGLRVPRTLHVRGLEDLDAVLELTCPLIVKPALHAPAYESQFRKAYRLETPEAARELLRKILAVLPDVVVQEWIPGDDADIYFCLQQLSRDGRALASFVGRKIRSWPPGVGGTASCIAAPEHAELTELTRRFFADVGMCGLASMEYKRHAATGEFVAIEPTVGRTDYQEEVATLNGVNLPYAYYCSLAGCDIPAATAPAVAIVWRDSLADAQSQTHPEQTVRGWPVQHGAIRDAVWRPGDPGPWLASQWARVLRRVRRIFNAHQSGTNAS